MTVGYKLRQIRIINAHLTQKEVGKALGVSASQISQWETGKRKPKYQTLIRIAELYGLKPDYFLKEVSNNGGNTRR